MPWVKDLSPWSSRANGTNLDEIWHGTIGWCLSLNDVNFYQSLRDLNQRARVPKPSTPPLTLRPHDLGRGYRLCGENMARTQYWCTFWEISCFTASFNSVCIIVQVIGHVLDDYCLWWWCYLLRSVCLTSWVESGCSRMRACFEVGLWASDHLALIQTQSHYFHLSFRVFQIIQPAQTQLIMEFIETITHGGKIRKHKHVQTIYFCLKYTFPL